MELGSVNINLSVSLTRFNEALNAAMKRINDLGREMEESFGNKPRKEIEKTQDTLSRFTWTARGYIKDTSKVVTGILISQGFYKLLNTIERATHSLFRFNNELQVAAISFKHLLGSRREADAFVQQLQDLAAETPLAFEQTLKLTEQLLAYGIPKDSVLYVLRSILDAAAIRGGGVDTIEGIGRAIGQMASKAKAEAQELRQLAEWGIPAYRILQEELGLTADQVQDIGKAGIPGIKAAAAILEGLEKRYKGAAEEVSRTTGGLIEKIGDNLKIMGNLVFAQVFESTRQFLTSIADRLEQLKDITRKYGVGGLFQELVSPRLRGAVKSVITGIVGIVKGLRTLWEALQPIASAVGEVVLRTLGLILPALGILLRMLGDLAKWLTHNVPLVRHLVGAIAALIITGMVVKVLGSLVTAIKALAIAGPVARLLIGLRDAIVALHAALIRNPIIGLITLASAALIGLALSSQTASRWLDHVMQKLAILLGLNIDKAFEPTDPKATAKWMDEYNKKLSEAAKGIGGVGDDAEESGKKVKDKFLAAFDEVYEIPENLGESGLDDALGGGQIPDISIPELPTDEVVPGRDKLEKVGGGLIDWFKDLMDRMRDMGPLILPPPMFHPPPPVLVENLEAFLIRLQEMYEGATAGVREWVRRFNEQLQRLGQPLGEVYDQIRDAVRDIIEGLKGLPARAGEVFETFKQRVRNAVTSVIEGFKTLPSRTAEAFEAFKQTVSEAMGRVASFLEENKGLIIAILVAIVLAVAAILIELPLVVAGGAAAFVIAIGTMFADAKEAAAAQLDQTTQLVATKWDQIKQVIETRLIMIWQSITSKWNQIRQTTSTKLVELWQTVSARWNVIKETISRVTGEIWKEVTAIWNRMKDDVAAITNAIATTTLAQWESLKKKLSDIWSSIKTAAKDIWTQTADTIRGTINYIISLINKFIRKWNSIRIRVPEFYIPFVGTFGGFTIELPDIPEIPLLDAGGVITQDTLARLAGNNRPEAVIPLSSEKARPFAQMIADAIVSAIGETRTEPSPPAVYVGTLIADERGLKELARKMEIINLREGQRRGAV